MRLFGIILLFLFFGKPVAGDILLGEPETRVEARERGLYYETRVRVAASLEEIMDLLTDFEAIPEYVPNVDSCRVVTRTDSSTLVRQVITTRLILSWTFRQELEIVQEGMGRLRFRQVQGNVHAYRGSWELTPVQGGVEIAALGQAEHLWRLPRFVMVWILRRQVSGLLPAVVKELERRQGMGAIR
jgi:ribosome-associated toxin RatA of RatAB toxin-antitoxin module